MDKTCLDCSKLDLLGGFPKFNYCSQLTTQQLDQRLLGSTTVEILQRLLKL